MSEMIFQISTELIEGSAVVRGKGELDVSSARTLQSQIDELLETSTVVVDLSEVTFIDSSGLSALVTAQKRREECGHHENLKLVVSQSRILKIFEVTGLQDAFAIFETLEEATK